MPESLIPVAWVPCGMIEQEPTEPSWDMLTTSEQHAKWWVEECKLHVKPVYLGSLI